MLLAEARLAASIMMSCSTTASLTGEEWVWMMNTWAPRIDSSKRQWISPLANSRRLASVRLTPSWLAMSLANTGWQRPVVSTSRRTVSDSTAPAYKVADAGYGVTWVKGATTVPASTRDPGESTTNEPTRASGPMVARGASTPATGALPATVESNSAAC